MVSKSPKSPTHGHTPARYELKPTLTADGKGYEYDWQPANAVAEHEQASESLSAESCDSTNAINRNRAKRGGLSRKAFARLKRGKSELPAQTQARLMGVHESDKFRTLTRVHRGIAQQCGTERGDPLDRVGMRKDFEYIHDG